MRSKKCALFLCFILGAYGPLRSPALASEVKSKSEVTYRKAVYSLPITYDPIQMNDLASLMFSEMVYEGLLRISDNYGYENALATSWTTSRDGKTLTFQIRPNAKFHDGSKVSASDVVASLTRAAGPKSKVASLYESIVGAKQFQLGRAKSVEGLKAMSNDVVVIQLVKPFPPMMYVLAGATAKVLPADRIDDPSFFRAPVGSGPFRFVRFDEKKRVVKLSKFIEHPRLKGNIDNIELVESNEEHARKSAMHGAIDDLTTFPLTGTEDVFSVGQHLSIITAQTWIIGLNSRLAPFNNVSSRQNFKADFDADKFRKTFYPDALQSFGYIPPGFPGYRSTNSKIDGIHSANSRSSRLVVIAIPDALSRSNEMAKYIEREFNSKGWNVKAKVLSWSEMMKGYEAKTLQGFLLSMNMDYPDSEFLLRNFESTNPDNFSGIHDHAIDNLLDQARSTSDRETRKTIYEKVTELINKAAPTINLFHPRAHIWVSNCVQGLRPNVLADTYIDYAVVSLKTDCVKRETAGSL